MKLSLGKNLFLISAILLIFGGIAAIFNPNGTLAAIAYILALVMLLSGVFDIIIYAVSRDGIFNAGWVLSDGILSLVIALLLFFNQHITVEVLPYIFGMWIIFTGVTRMITSFDMKKLEVHGWGWLSLVGAFAVFLGTVSFFFPNAAALAVSIFVGAFFIIQGVAMLLLWMYGQKLNS